jgi:hypothetical protein
MMKRLLSVLGLTTALTAAAGAEPPKPLFADDQPIHLTIKGAIGRLVSSEDRSHSVPALVSVGADSMPAQLSPRGITRLRKDTCDFPPIRVDFTGAPPTNSIFAGQKRLKLVTHCRANASFQQYVLLEYATYRLYNLLSPMSFRARLAQVDYVEDNGRPSTSRIGFFIEDLSDVARRNGMKEARVGARIPVANLNPSDAGRYAVFQYLISNLDWAMQAGPAGDTCCHNSRLISASGAPPWATVPYDFDYSGLVDAPYAAPPEGINVSSVKVRRYRGFCRHNAEALRAAADIRAQKPAMLAVLGQIPQLNEGTRRKAGAFLERSFNDIASDETVTKNLLATCLN